MHQSETKVSISSNIDVPIPERLPFFITAPGETDVLFQLLIIIVVIAVFFLGTFYLHLHSVPDHMAHKSDGAQLQVVGILTLLALFTHNNLFWVAALLLAAINLPDFLPSLKRIARALETIANQPQTTAVPAKEEDSNA